MATTVTYQSTELEHSLGFHFGHGKALATHGCHHNFRTKLVIWRYVNLKGRQYNKGDGKANYGEGKSN